MMSLLSVTVKKARYVGAQATQFNTYVTLKLQNVKSTTVTVKGATPCWEQDFLFETSDLNTGLLIEVWNKGMIWDRALGYHWIPLRTVHYSNEEGTGQWLSLDAELVMTEGEVIGTKVATGHSILMDCRFELPFDPENVEAMDLQRKFEMLNNSMDQEARAEQARRQMQYFGSGYSEDSDYTSDINYPVGQHPNSSASQFRTAAYQINTPQGSLETSRENSYERDDAQHHHHHHQQQQHHHHLNQPQVPQHHLSPETHRRHHLRHSPRSNDYTSAGSHNSQPYQENHIDSEPLFYNSRPLNRNDHSSQEAWVSCESSFYNPSVESMDVGYGIDMDFDGQFGKALRRPSLERQSTLYDDYPFYVDSNVYSVDVPKNSCATNVYPSKRTDSYDEFYDSLPYPVHEERYGQDEEDRQWDSGGLVPPPKPHSKPKKLPAIPSAVAAQRRRASVIALDTDHFRPTSTPTARRQMPQVPPLNRALSKQSIVQEALRSTPDNFSHRGASLPPTPTKGGAAKGVALPNSLPRTTGRQLPMPNAARNASRARRRNLLKRTTSADYTDNAPDEYYDDYYARPGAVSAAMFNEDYNYAYQSNDNLPAQQEQDVLPPDNSNFLRGFQDDDYYYYGDASKRPAPPRRGADVAALASSSPLTQQNTDSLESRDDELNSYDTAVSSVSSSMQQLRSAQQEYSTAGGGGGETAPMPMTTHNLDIVQRNIMNVSQYPGDQHHQQPSMKAIVATQPVITVAQVHNHNTTTVRGTQHGRAQLKQQESVDSGTDYMQNKIVVNDAYNKYTAVHNDAYLGKQESVESYVEEETDDAVTNGINADYSNKAINQDSPLSVIHVENYEDEHNSLRRGSSQITVVDPYHPSLQQRPQQQQQQPAMPTVVAASRRSSGADPYPRLGSTEQYQSFDDQYSVFSRKPSNAEILPPPQSAGAAAAASRRLSLRQSPGSPECRADLRHLEEAQEATEETVADAQLIEEVAEEEEDAHKEPKTQVTAQQRWLWAYNKIIMQLDVQM